jgi:DNA-binding MarR family transcriptional regulator
MSAKQKYYTVIPTGVRNDKSLTPEACLLYGDIAGLCRKNGTCKAGNEFFARISGADTSSVSKYVKALERAGHIVIRYVYEADSKRIDYRIIKLTHTSAITAGDPAPEEKGYYSIIPADVRADKRVPARARMLYGDIAALCDQHGACGKSNAYFAAAFGADTSSVSKWTKALETAGYISIGYDYEPGSKEIARRVITLVPGRAEIKKEHPAAAITEAPEAEKAEKAEKGIEIRRDVVEILRAVVKSGKEGVELPPECIEKSAEILIQITSTATTTPRGEKTAEAVVFKNEKEKREKPEKEVLIKPDSKDGKNAGPEETTPGPEALKASLKELDPRLIFDPGFYRLAASCLERNRLARTMLSGDGYVRWLYQYCRQKKNVTSFNGLYHSLFCKPEIIELYQSIAAKTPAVSAASKTADCPVCGTKHDRDRCPVCGLARYADTGAIERHRRYYALPPDRKAAYDAALKECYALPPEKRFKRINEVWRQYNILPEI